MTSVRSTTLKQAKNYLNSITFFKREVLTSCATVEAVQTNSFYMYDKTFCLTSESRVTYSLVLEKVGVDVMHLSIQSLLSLQTAEHRLHLSVSPALPKLKRGASGVIDVRDWELFAGP